MEASEGSWRDLARAARTANAEAQEREPGPNRYAELAAGRRDRDGGAGRLAADQRHLPRRAVRQAIECLAKAAAPPARPDATEDGEPNGDAEAVKAHAHGEVLEFEVPEGKTSVRTRVVPEVTVEDGEVHARVKVDDPNWVREPGSPE